MNGSHYSRRIILIADDEIVIRKLVIAMLIPEGYTVLTAEDGYQARQIIENFGGPIDIAFCDIRMPGPSGLELREIIFKHRPGTKVVILSGDTALGGIPTGVTTFAKPFTTGQFRQFIRELLQLRELVTQRTVRQVDLIN
jgi:DNA-binding NtrC family response regulator